MLAHTDQFFVVEKKIGVKIGSCALTFGPTKIGPIFSWKLLTRKNRSVCADFSPIKIGVSDVIQQWDITCHCHTQ